MAALKKKNKQINSKVTGLLLGVTGFCLPLIFHFDGLTYAGHIALGIFLMAAVFWMFETLPIYSTSMLVIFLQVALLSQQGLIYSDAEVPVLPPVSTEDGTWIIPATSLTDNTVYLVENGQTRPVEVFVLQQGAGGQVEVDAEIFETESEIVADTRHKLVGYRPVSFSVFFATLASPIIMLFLGGFILAAASVKYNLDKNLTNVLLKPFGQKPIFIALGLMLVTAILSAFMSNTATTAMMMTVAIPIAAQIDKSDPFRIMLTLSIPIAANIGGMATPIGTPPNAIVIANLSQQGINIPFGTWVAIMLPLAVGLLFLAWFTMRFFFPPVLKEFTLVLKGEFEKNIKAIILYVVFGITVLLWFTEANHGIPSSMVAFLPIVALTVTSVLSKDDIRSLPWEVLWLVAGGISLGISMENTGLAMWLVSSISWDMLPQILLLLVFGLVALMLSNFLSNTVTATLLVPLAVSMGTSGIAGEGFSLIITSLVIGAACNMAMLLPISTPPNAIAMSTGYIRSQDMIKMGLVIGIIGITIALLLGLFYWPILTH